MNKNGNGRTYIVAFVCVIAIAKLVFTVCENREVETVNTIEAVQAVETEIPVQPKDNRISYIPWEDINDVYLNAKGQLAFELADVGNLFDDPELESYDSIINRIVTNDYITGFANEGLGIRFEDIDEIYINDYGYIEFSIKDSEFDRYKDFGRW